MFLPAWEVINSDVEKYVFFSFKSEDRCFSLLSIMFIYIFVFTFTSPPIAANHRNAHFLWSFLNLKNIFPLKKKKNSLELEPIFPLVRFFSCMLVGVNFSRWHLIFLTFDFTTFKVLNVMGRISFLSKMREKNLTQGKVSTSSKLKKKNNNKRNWKIFFFRFRKFQEKCML